MTDTDKSDSLDPIPEEVDKGLELAYGGKAQPAPQQSVIQQIAAMTGTTPKVNLRDPDMTTETPMLHPLGPGQRIDSGKYVVQGELGHGGVGAVHKAHDQDLGRDVAMKFLHERYKDEPSIMHRFVEEAQIGGQLQHPGIVPVYDLGIVDGKPFFAMKLVKGETLAKKLSDRVTVTADRHTFITTFEQVCQTMAYAHARGVVHRDLKPANIMIGNFGEVQIVDWGMGKVLRGGGVADEQRSIARQADLSVIETARSSGAGTQSIMGSVMGTPGYMPPEQARGDVEAMDERSDVFALGAILCEILTGLPPYTGDQQSMIAMAAMCRLDDANERLAASEAEPELVELAQQCMMPAPAARPQSAEQVAKQVRAYLSATENRVQDARVEAAEAKVRVAGLKRTAIVGVTLSVFVAIGLAASLWLWSEAATQREQANYTADFMSGILEGAGPLVATGRDTEMLGEMLDSAAARITAGELEGNLEAELRLRSTIGTTYITLGKVEAGARLLQRAEAMARAAYTEDDAAKARAIHDVALVYQATQRERSADLSREALQMMRRLDPSDREELAAALQRLGNTLVRGELDWPGARDALQEALAIRQRLYRGDHHGIATVFSMLAHVHAHMGEIEQALEHARAALAMFERLFPDGHPGTMGAHLGLASLLLRSPNEAEPHVKAALALAKRLWRPGAVTIANAQLALAAVWTTQNKHLDAQRLFRDAMTVLDQTENHLQRANVRVQFADSLIKTHDYEEAAELMRTCVSLREEEFGDHWRTWSARRQLGGALVGLEKFAEAEPLLLAAYRGLKASEGLPPPAMHNILTTIEYLIKLYEATDNETEAAKWRTKLEAARAELRERR